MVKIQWDFTKSRLEMKSKSNNMFLLSYNTLVFSKELEYKIHRAVSPIVVFIERIMDVLPGKFIDII